MQAAAYILARTCPSGGFCFYRLDEPNTHNTYCALAASWPSVSRPEDCQLSPSNPAGKRRVRLAGAGVFLAVQPLHDPASGIALFAARLTACLRGPADSATSLLQTLHQLAMLRGALQLAVSVLSPAARSGRWP
jgi:hypothetical protein